MKFLRTAISGSVAICLLLAAAPSSAIATDDGTEQTAYTRARIANYKSCSYPPGPGGPVKPDAKSWKAQGFTNQVRGIDVSMWQHPDNKPIDFAKLKEKYNLSFVFIKGSDGGNRDKGKSKKWYPIDSAAARAEGLIVGAYHYAVPGVLHKDRATDAKLQAKMIVNRVGGSNFGDLPIVLDFEELPCGWSVKKLGYWARDFVLEAQRLTGRKPIIYANGTFIKRLNAAKVAGIDFSDYPLWLAQWGKGLGNTPNEVPIWGAEWTFWQFTSWGALKGVPTARTDLNVFNGTKAQLIALTNQ